MSYPVFYLLMFFITLGTASWNAHNIARGKNLWGWTIFQLGLAVMWLVMLARVGLQ